jgi:recombination protein RecA
MGRKKKSDGLSGILGNPVGSDLADDEDIIVEEKKKKSLDIDDLYVSAHTLLDRKQIIIPTSPNTDTILGGGIPEGSFVLVTGPKKIGKTTWALDFCSSAQQKKYAIPNMPEGRHIYYANVEGRIKSRDLLGIPGLDIDRFHLIQSEEGNILSGEEYINRVELLIHSKPGSIFIVDSFSQLCTAGEMSSDLGDRYRADAPVLLAKFCRRICNVLPINRCILIGITHLIANQNASPGSSPWSEASGQKIQYAADIKLKATFMTPWRDGETQIGQDINWTCETSAIGPPGGKCVSKLRYGYGIDEYAEIAILASDFSIIEKKGSWFTLPNGEKAQGLEKVRQYLLDNPGVYKDVCGQIRKISNLP